MLLDKVMEHLDKIDLTKLPTQDRDIAEKLKKHINQRLTAFKVQVAQFDAVMQGLK